MRQKKEIVLECFRKVYRLPAWHRSALVCIGGLGQPKCKYLKKCIEQYDDLGLSKKEIAKMVRKYVTNNKN